MKCIYHSADLDGQCSGAIIKHKYPECEMIGLDYDDDLPTIENETLFVIDFSFQPFSKMIELANRNNLTWIDHHATAIQEYEKYGLDTTVYLEIGKAACELTWEHIVGTPMPLIVRCLGRYDVWDCSHPQIMDIQYGIRLYDTDPNNQPFWKLIFKDDNHLIKEIIRQGRTILTYKSKENEKFVNKCSFETKFEGFRCIATNIMLTNSQLFDSVWDDNKYDMMITFGWRNNRWMVSLYSNKPDIHVGRIAKKHGGGGHKNAAGFICDELPFAL